MFVCLCQVSLSVAVGIPTRKRKPLTEAELELRRKRREEAAAKRAKLQEDLKRKQQAKKYHNNVKICQLNDFNHGSLTQTFCFSVCAEWHGGSPLGTGHFVCRLWGVRKTRMRRMTAALAPWTRTVWKSTMFLVMWLTHTLPKEMLSSSIVLVSGPTMGTLSDGHPPNVSLTPWLVVDDSGRWGRGGLFTALEVRSDQPRKQYELAGKMKGDEHL